LLRTICEYDVLSIKQIKTLFDGNDAIINSVLFKKLLNYGYLSEITDNDAKETFYCISDLGVNIFRKEKCIEFFKQTLHNFSKPNNINSVSVFEEDEDLLLKVINLNKILFQLDNYYNSMEKANTNYRYEILINYEKEATSIIKG